MVPGAGLEPAWSLLRGILSPLRLPVSPPGQVCSSKFPIPIWIHIVGPHIGVGYPLPITFAGILLGLVHLRESSRKSLNIGINYQSNHSNWLRIHLPAPQKHGRRSARVSYLPHRRRSTLNIFEGLTMKFICFLI